MDLPKKIVTANDIVSKVLKFDDNNFILDDMLMERLREKTLKQTLEAWDYVLNLEDKSMGALLNFFKKYNLTDEEIITIHLTPPDKELLEYIGLPQDILNRVDTGYAKCKDNWEFIQKQCKLQEQKQEILDYLEALVFEKKLKIIGEWQGENTRIIITDREEIDKLFMCNTTTARTGSKTDKELHNKVKEICRLIESSLPKNKKITKQEFFKRVGNECSKQGIPCNTTELRDFWKDDMPNNRKLERGEKIK